MREFIITPILLGFDPKKNFFLTVALKFNNLGLALTMALKVYTSVEKRLKLEGEGRGAFGSPILNSVTIFIYQLNFILNVSRLRV